MARIPTIAEQSDRLLIALSAVMGTGVSGEASEQLVFIEQLDAIEAAAAAAKARISVRFAQDRVRLSIRHGGR